MCVLKFQKDPYLQRFQGQLGEKITPISCKNKDNFAFKNTPFLPSQGYFSKNSTCFFRYRGRTWKL